MSFENLNAVRRTDEMFRKREQPLHHKHDSVLEKLNIDMIKSFSIADPLHLLELGKNYNILTYGIILIMITIDNK